MKYMIYVYVCAKLRLCSPGSPRLSLLSTHLGSRPSAPCSWNLYSSILVSGNFYCLHCSLEGCPQCFHEVLKKTALVFATGCRNPEGPHTWLPKNDTIRFDPAAPSALCLNARLACAAYISSLQNHWQCLYQGNKNNKHLLVELLLSVFFLSSRLAVDHRQSNEHLLGPTVLERHTEYHDQRVVKDKHDQNEKQCKVAKKQKTTPRKQWKIKMWC